MTQSNVDLIKAFGVNVCDGISPLPFTLMKSLLSVDKSERNKKRLGKLVSNYLRLSPNTSDKDKQVGTLLFNKNTLGIYKVLKRDGGFILETVYHPNMELIGREFKQLIVNNYDKIPSGLEEGVYQLIFNDSNITSLPVVELKKQNETAESTSRETEFKQLDELVDIFCSNPNKLKYKAFTDKTKQMIVDVLPIDVDDLMLDAVITAVMHGTHAQYIISRYFQEVYKGYHLYILYGSTKYIHERTENSEFKGVKIMTIDKFKSIIDSVEKPEEKTFPTTGFSEYHTETVSPKDVVINNTLDKVIEAYNNGAEIEAKGKNGTQWTRVRCPDWLPDVCYRVKFTDPIGASKTDDSCTMVTENVKKQDDLIDPKYNGIYKSKVASNKFVIRAGKLITGNVSDSFDANSIIAIFLADNYDTECWIGSTWAVTPLEGAEQNLHDDIYASDRCTSSILTSGVTEKMCKEVTFSDTVDKYVARRRRRRT